MDNKIKLVIYMPALNEEERIGDTLRSLPKKLNGVDEIEVLVVDDGSTDNTKKIARECGAKVFSHGTNKGVGAAFHSGVEQSLHMGADIMLSIDADGQFDVNNIPSLLEPILKNRADFTTGNRFHKEGDRPEFMSRVKYWGNKQIARLVSTMAGHKIRDVACGFRAYNREVLLNLNLSGTFTYTQETILNLTYKEFRLTEVPISVKYFADRKSRVASSIFKYALNTFLIIIRSYRDYQPLRFFGLSGIAIFLMGLGLDIWLVIHYIQVGTFSPFKVFGFLGGLLNLIGVLTIILALIADMLGRIRTNQEQMLYLQKKDHFRSTRLNENEK
ncbi:glycosyltransferase family 2 protein [Candidatus Peregrinibacteria bacterium]|nr:glycosyltransferase family 2 protein [Candidatus Peregrinibacteria bacterium]